MLDTSSLTFKIVKLWYKVDVLEKTCNGERQSLSEMKEDIRSLKYKY